VSQASKLWPSLQVAEEAEGSLGLLESSVLDAQELMGLSLAWEDVRSFFLCMIFLPRRFK
jgi:hypothetical protein